VPWAADRRQSLALEWRAARLHRVLRNIVALPMKRAGRWRRRAVSLVSTSLAEAALALAFASALLSGCRSMDCIDIACGPPSVEIQFKPTITEAGHYRLDLEVDGVRSTCEVEFRTDGGWSGASACNSLILRGGVSRDLATEIIGYSLPEGDNVSLALFRNGEPWVEHRFVPRYRGVEIAGEGCGECIVAIEEVVLP
jgi:hypothetical protein